MIILGTLMAIMAGMALPGHMLLFGLVINEFVYHGIARNLTLERMANSTLNLTLPQTFEGHFCSNTTGGNILLNVIPYLNNPNDLRATLLQQIGQFALYYVAIASAVLVAIFLATVFWNASAYRQTRRMRLAFYRSILRQNIGWFDVTEANELSTRLAE